MEIDINTENVTKKSTQQDYLDTIPIINKHTDYNTFFENYLLQNQPCIIKNISSHWKATKYWLNENKTDVNFKYLDNKYADCSVLTYDCNVKFHNSHKTQKIPFQQYLVYWEAYRESNYSDEYPLLYLKDWHLKNTYPHDKFYKVPTLFSSDWLNEYLVDLQKDDYRFVYMGPKGTWTPFHADVFKSYSWSVNIIGKKHWILLPPGQEKSLRDNLGNFPHEIVDVVSKLKHYDVIQETGDAIFVPSGWYHQVKNLEDTISINHNWINGCNIHLVYIDMQNHLEEVKQEIADCREDPEFEAQCQVVLNASYGMNYKEFLDFVYHITEKRIKAPKPFSNRIQFDFLRIKEVLELFLGYKDTKQLKLDKIAQTLHDKIVDIII